MNSLQPWLLLNQQYHLHLLVLFDFDNSESSEGFDKHLKAWWQKAAVLRHKMTQH